MKTWLSLVTAVLVSASVAQAQYGSVPFYSSRSYGYGYGDPYGYYGYSYGGTVAESHMRGMAEIIRAHAEHEETLSRARINIEKARQEYLKNRRLATQTYLEVRRTRTAFRAQQRAERRESFKRRRASARKPPPAARLSASQLDPVTGEISWPAVLQENRYAAHRERLEALFARRATTGAALSPTEYGEIRQTSQAMRAELRQQIREMKPGEYIVARKFLDGLANESRLPTG